MGSMTQLMIWKLSVWKCTPACIACCFSPPLMCVEKVSSNWWLCRHSILLLYSIIAKLYTRYCMENTYFYSFCLISLFWRPSFSFLITVDEAYSKTYDILWQVRVSHMVLLNSHHEIKPDHLSLKEQVTCILILMVSNNATYMYGM